MKDIFFNARVLILLFLLYPLLFIWQGLDFTDYGYLMTNFQQFFNDPLSISASMFFWLTNLIGAVWVYFFGDLLGVWGIRLAGVLILYATAFFAYLILKPYLKKEELQVGFVLSMLYIRNWNIIHYNNLTALFFIAGIYFLINGLKNSKKQWLYLAGLILGLNIFIRFPNILGFLLVIIILLYGYVNKSPDKIRYQQTFWFCFGYLTAIILILLTMKLLGHYEYFKEALNGLSGLAADESSGHGIIFLMKLIIKKHYRIFTNLIFLFILTFLLQKIYCWIKDKSKLLVFLICIICVILMIISIRKVFLGMLYLVLIVHILGYRKEQEKKGLWFVSVMSLLLLFLIPLGSNVGLEIAESVMWLAIPIAYFKLVKFKEINVYLQKRINFRLDRTEIDTLKKFLLFSFIAFCLAESFTNTYRDSANRFSMVYSVRNPLLRGVFTTRERATIVQELLDEIPKYVKKDDYLIADEETAMLHFLTKTRPYLYNSWPMLYTPAQFEQKLKCAIKERPYLPVVVRTKAKIASKEWPNVVGLRHSERHDGNRAIMNDFLNKYHYSVVWENQFFLILLPQQTEK